MKYPPDAASSHKYEVKKVHTDGKVFDAVVFYLRAGEPVKINVEEVLKKTNLWIEPATSNQSQEHHLIFEVEPEDDTKSVELYMVRTLPPQVRVINLGDARHTHNVLGHLNDAPPNLYGFNPIPAGGSAVTNELVNKLREELGI